MGRKKTVVTTTENDDLEVPPAVPNAQGPQLEDAPDPIETLFDEFESRDDIFINVYRLMDGTNLRNRAQQFCFRVAAEECDMGSLMQKLQNEPWNGGEFRLVARDAVQIVSRRDVHVASIPREKPVERVADVATQVTSALTPVLTQMMEMVKAVTQRPDPNQQMMQTLTMMKLMREAVMGDAPTVQQKPAQSITEKMAELVEVKAQMDALGLSDREPSILSTLAPMAGKFMESMAAMQQQMAQNTGQRPLRVPAVQRPRIAPPAQPAPVVTAPASVAPPMDTGLAGIVRSAVTYLLPMANSNADAKITASQMLELVPENQFDALMDFVDDDNFINSVIQIAPEFQPHAAWLLALQTALLDLTEEESPESPASDPLQPET